MRPRKLSFTLLAMLVALVGLYIGQYVKQKTIDTTPGAPNAASKVNKDSLHRTTHRLFMSAKFNDSGYCSGSAIGPHAFLTAAHCEAPEMNLAVDGEPVAVTKMLHDHNDHVIFLLAGVVFTNYVTLCSDSVSQGDRVFMWGNPESIVGMYREGYVSGVHKQLHNDGSETLDTMLTINNSHGDSGASVFTEQGCVAGVYSYLIGSGTFLLHGMLPLKFTDEQIQEARNY
jgi:trypsin-like peptidase